MRRIFGIIILLMMLALSACAKVPARIVDPGQPYDAHEPGVCFNVNDLKNLYPTCNIKVVK